jgi:hypothetical protein
MEQIFIYLIIFVVLILFSARQNKKKQQAAKQTIINKQNVQQQQQPETLEDIFKKLGSENFFSSESNMSSDAYIPQESSETQVLNFEKRVPEVKKFERKISKRKQREEIFSEEIGSSEITDQTIDFQFDNPDEMKKAIIYSEIINRKYV